MTIPEAIERLETWQKQTHGHLISDYKDAVQLGIEALKRVRGERTGYESYAPDLLPGETP